MYSTVCASITNTIAQPLTSHVDKDVYFIFAGFHLAFCTYAFIGIPSSGCAGLINLISRFATGHIVAGVFCILATIGWALQGLSSLWMYKQVWAHSHGKLSRYLS